MSVVLIGVGNVVRGDDGVGVHALRRLVFGDRIADAVKVVEGGTAGLLLLPFLEGAERLLVLDAIDGGAAPGTLHRIEGAALGRPFAQRLTPHDIGLADLLGAATLAGTLPRELVMLGLQPFCCDLGTALSAPVARALGALVDAAQAQLAAWSPVSRVS